MSSIGSIVMRLWVVAAALLAAVAAPSILAGSHERESNAIRLDTRDGGGGWDELESSGIRLDTRSLPGDVNGDGAVTMADALLVGQYAAGLRRADVPLYDDLSVADVDRDGDTDANDADLIASYLGEFGVTLDPVAPGLSIGAVAPVPAQPGQIVTITLAGTRGAAVREVRFGSFTSGVVNQTGCDVRVVVPVVPPGQYALQVVLHADVVPGVPFQVLALAPSSMTTAELQQALDDGTDALVTSAQGLLATPGLLPSDQATELTSTMDAIRAGLSLVREQIADLTPEQRALLENLLRNAGLLDLLQDLGLPKGGVAQAKDVFVLNSVYLGLDTFSFCVGNINAVLGPLTLVAAVTPGGQPVAAVLHTAKTVLALAKSIVDLFPTDLQTASVTLADADLDVGDATLATFSGDFLAQSDVVTALFSTAVGLAAGSEWDRYMTAEASALLRPQIRALGDFYAGQAEAITDEGLSDLFSRLRWPDRHVAVDPALYRVTVLNLLTLSVPNLGATAVANFLEKIGVDIGGATLYDPVTFTPADIAEMTPLHDRQMTAQRGGSGQLQFRGFRFEARPGWLGWAMGIHEQKTVPATPVPFAVRAPVSTGTIYVSSNVSAPWSIGGPDAYAGTTTPETLSNCAPGPYTITWGNVSGYTAPPSWTRTLSAGSSITFTGSYVAATTGMIQGVVRDGLTRTGLSGVNLTFYAASSGAALGPASTNSGGQYSVTLTAGEVYGDVTRLGYIGTRVYTRVNQDQTTQVETVLFAQNLLGTGVVSGTVINALTGNGVPNAVVRLRSGVGARTGTVAASVTANSSGAYSTTVSGGTYTAEASATGYVTSYATVVAVGTQTIANQNVTVTPVLGEGEMRIVLSWGSVPSDLDSHLTGPLAADGRFHVFYNSRGSQTSAPYAALDVDDTSSYGPETVTVTQWLSGTYRYSVHNYSYYGGTYGTLRTLSEESDATVKVFQDAGEIARFSVPSGHSGDLWTVFEVDGATRRITPVNAFTSGARPSDPNAFKGTPTDAALLRKLPAKGGEADAKAGPVAQGAVRFGAALVRTEPMVDFMVDVLATAGTDATGAYKLVLLYDPGGIEVLSVADGGSLFDGPHRGASINNAGGRTVVVDYQARSLWGPVGGIRLFRLSARARVGGEHTIRLVPVDLVATRGMAVDAGDGGADEAGRLLRVVPPDYPLRQVVFGSGGNGTLTGNALQTVDPGGSTTAVMAVPAYGFVFTQWSDGATANPRLLTGVTGDTTLTASFQVANPVVPNGSFLAAADMAAVGAGLGWYDLTGTYDTTVAGNPLVMNLVHDTRGKLTGTATYAAAGSAAVTMPVRGSVRSLGGAVLATMALNGTDSTGTVRVSLSFRLTVDAAWWQLPGSVAGRIKVGAANTPVSQSVALAIPAPVDGTWTLAFQLAQAGRAVTGTALLELSNGVVHAFVVRGKASGAKAVLSLAGDPADPASKAIKIKTVVTTLEGGWARLEAFSAKGYGQTLAW